MRNTEPEHKKIQWAKEQMEKFEWNLKFGGKWEQIEAEKKLNKIHSLSDDEFKEAAIASYDRVHLGATHE